MPVNAQSVRGKNIEYSMVSIEWITPKLICLMTISCVAYAKESVVGHISSNYWFIA